MYSIHAELFSEYAVGLVIIAIRFYARWYTGARNFYWDDLCLGFAVIFWTFHTVFLYLMDVYGSNIGLNNETAMQIPDSEVGRLRQGSIFAFIAWLSYIFMVWSFKGVLMFLYNRITAGLWQHRFHLFMTFVCVSTFLASLLFHLCICTPTNRTWQIKPYPGDNCTLAQSSTDIGVLCIPMPLIIAAKIPRSQKVILGILFSSGIFIMIAAILRAYYSVTNLNTLSVALGWASREALVSAFVVSAPGIKPLISHFGWFKSLSSSNRYTGPYSNQRTPRSFLHSKSNNDDRHPYEMGWLKKSRRESSGESQENIIEAGRRDIHTKPKEEGEGITVTTEYSLAHDNKSFVGGSRDVEP
ncbi:hypothetical protein AWENTII_003449 [Aspergillus wentii]